MVKGLARGFLSKVCIIAPETARAAPTKIDVNIRGKRMFHTIIPAAPL